MEDITPSPAQRKAWSNLAPIADIMQKAIPKNSVYECGNFDMHSDPDGNDLYITFHFHEPIQKIPLTELSKDEQAIIKVMDKRIHPLTSETKWFGAQYVADKLNMDKASAESIMDGMITKHWLIGFGDGESKIYNVAKESDGNKIRGRKFRRVMGV